MGMMIEARDLNDFLRRTREKLMMQGKERGVKVKRKGRTKDRQIFFRCYTDFYEKVRAAGELEDKDVNEYTVKVLCDKLGLSYMDYK